MITLKENDKNSNIAALCLILAIFVNIASPIIMQAVINDIFEVNSIKQVFQVDKDQLDEAELQNI